MRTLVLSCLAAVSACATTTSDPTAPTDYTPDGTQAPPPAPCAAPDPTVSDSSLPAPFAGEWTWSNTPLYLAAGWSQICSGLQDCVDPWDPDDGPVYAQCTPPAITSSITTDGVPATVTKTGTSTLEGTYDQYTVTPTQAGTFTIHATTTNTTTGQHAGSDVTYDVRDLEDLRFRCIVGPSYDTATPCPSPLPKGTPFAVAIDGLYQGRYYTVYGTVTFTGVALTQSQSCEGNTVPGDDHYTEYCYLDPAPTQSVTVTMTAAGLTRSYTVTVE